MRKNLFLGFIAFAALTVTSCSNDEIMEAVPQKQAIEFGTYLGRDAETRVAELSTTGMQATGFGVFASYTNEANWSTTNVINFMYNQQVKYSLGWTYSPKKYWPTNQGDQISFWAYGPYATTDNGIAMKSTAGEAGTPVLTYTISADKLDKQADLTTDVAMNVVKDASTNPDGSHRTIEFTLKHELTRVAISAKLDKTIDSNTKVNIKSVTFGGANFATSADYTFAAATDNRGSWTNGTTGTLSLDKILAKTEAENLGNYAQQGVFLTGEAFVKLFGDEKYLFLIPLAEGLDAGEVTMTIEYDIVTKDEALNGNHSVTSATKIITLPTDKDLFMQGYAYQFNLTFNMNEIVLSASVDDSWESGTYETNVDWNDTDSE